MDRGASAWSGPLLGTAAVIGGLTVLGSGAARGQAAKSFKAALIGCGGRGGGAIRNIIDAGKEVGVGIRVVALADPYPERSRRVRGALKKVGQDVPEAQCFGGFDGYKKVMDTDAEIVLMATPPAFRPAHFEAAVAAGKHVFVEKPVAVDPAGCRRMFAAGELAAKKGLAVLAGTCLRHNQGYAAMRKLVADGAIGTPRAGNVYYCTGRLWFRRRAEGWSDAEYLVRNWVSFAEMSGDHIVEQHVHTIDMFNWVVGAHPVAAAAFGGRHRRQTGNQFDFFSIDYEYPDRVYMQSGSRQINGCWSWGNGIHVVGEKGWANIRGGVQLWDGSKVPAPDLSLHRNMYVQEHIVLLKSLVDGKPINDAKNVTEATLTAIMGRIAAYTGKRVEWRHLVDPGAKSPLYELAYTPGPEAFETGDVKAPPDDVVPVPGKG